MILNEKHTTVAYRCPDCGSGVMSAVGLFALSADMIKLKCNCKKSELKIVYNRDKTVRLTVPCLFCSTPHTFTVANDLFFSDELFTMACPYTDVNLCFTGEINRVKAELARTELELLDMLEEQGIHDFSALHGGEEDLSDPQVRDIVLFVINDLDEEGKIFCRCEPKKPSGENEAEAAEESRYDADVTADGIRVSCRCCGASRLIPTDSMLGAHAFLTCDALYLE